MTDLKTLSRDYSRVEKAIRFLGENFHRQPELKEIAGTAGVSVFHFQRIFQRWAGISPKRFVQFLTKEHAKQLLKNFPVLDASYEAGLSGPGRLHELFVSCEAVSPGEYREKGAGLTMVYGFHPTPFGECFIALSGRGVCRLVFFKDGEREKTLETFKREWPRAAIKSGPGETRAVVGKIFQSASSRREPLRVLCRGTNFQIKVWEALLTIPPGAVTTYQAIARQIGSPKAVRAVGTAVSRNPVAYLIPCHRVIRSMGGISGYRWGVERKKAMLAREAAVVTQM